MQAQAKAIGVSLNPGAASHTHTHTCYPSTWEAEAGESCLSLAWATCRDCKKTGLSCNSRAPVCPTEAPSLAACSSGSAKMPTVKIDPNSS